MSTRIPPDDPSRAGQEASRFEEREKLRQDYVDDLRRVLSREVSESRGRIQDTLEQPMVPDMVYRTSPNIAGWVATLLQSVTLVTIVGCAFWLGSLSTTVSNTSQKLDKLNDGIVGISKDSLSNRLATIETKLDNIDKKLESNQQSPRK